MTAERPTIRLLAGHHRRVRAGHPWAYSNEVEMSADAKALEPGSMVDLATADGQPLGTAMFNPRTLIAARMLSPVAGTTVDTAFLAARLSRALALRQRLYNEPFYRLVHAEADGLPGLVVDRMGDVVILQANSAGMARLEPALVEAVEMVLTPRAVVLKNDSAMRGLEGLASEVRLARGDLDGPVEIRENDAIFFVDPLGGQKTGWFFDQRDNRAFVARLAAGARVADFYAYAGGFAVLAAKAGAAETVVVDRSKAALEMAERAAEANGVRERCRFVAADAFREMARLGAAGERFGLVVADPPAFVKSRRDLHSGAKGYRKMTRLAAELVEPGGFLLVASCSHNVDPELFAEQVRRGLSKAGRNGRILRSAGAAPDHPVHPFLPESAYLKAMVLQLD